MTKRAIWNGVVPAESDDTVVVEGIATYRTVSVVGDDVPGQQAAG